MKNKWLTYGFLFLMIVALVVLAILQYHWLGSVSKAEKARLEENLNAAIENFVADYDRIFDNIRNSFHLQVSDTAADYDMLIGESYLNWLETSSYPLLINSVYLIEIDQSKLEVFQFNTDQVSLKPVPLQGVVENWARENLWKTSRSAEVMGIKRITDFGSPTFVPIPVQKFKVNTLKDQESGQRIKLNLSLNEFNKVVLIQLNDEIIKEQLIPEIARKYFSESFRDQYHLSIVNRAKKDSVYFSTITNGAIPKADFKKSLHRYNISKLMIFRKENQIPVRDLSLRLDSLFNRLDRIQVNELNSEEANEEKKNNGSLQTQFIESGEGSVNMDTSSNINFVGNLNPSGWELWLSFKSGSLDEFLKQTKNRNLVISFGILLVLGISGFMIVHFAKKSRDLANQQMLFVAGVSHELRTPITVIRSAAENLSEGVVQDENRKYEYARLMLKEGRRLSKMVDQIMEFSGIQSGKKVYHSGKISISELLDEIKAQTAVILNESDVKMNYLCTTNQRYIKADFDALLMAVMNLIQNAVKFGGDSGVISLRIDDTELRGKHAVRFSVHDYGPGIPPDEIHDIFQPFYLGRKSIEEQIKGNGLGLSLVKKIADVHDGEIRVKSKVGEGATFSLIIPVGTNYG